MGDIANQDEARRCLEIASAALQAGNIDKASRFADKAMKLYPNDEVRKVLRAIRSKQATPSSAPSSSTPNGTASAGMRQRSATIDRQDSKPEDRSTADQRELVASILRKKDFYEILGVSKDSNDDDIKRAYKKLALKLHPDKNTAPRSDEAFKKVSKAFSCLSDTQKRAAYDRYGDDQPSGRGMNGPFSQGGQGFDDFDPNEIFNMFFGFGNGGFAGQRNAQAFRQFGGGFGPFGGQQRQRPAEPQNLANQLLGLLPIVLMLLFTFFAMKPSEPIFSLDRTADFGQQIKSSRFDVPFFVKTGLDFDRTYPRGSRERAQIEREAEVGFRDRLNQRCHMERMNRDRMFRWGQSAKAKAMSMPACDEIAEKFGNQYAYQSSMYGY